MVSVSAIRQTIEKTPTGRPRVAIETHGCKLNRADSEEMARQFADAGFQLVSTNEPADVYVVNTCTVTHVADRKARRALRSAAVSNPQALVVAAGCYVQRSAETLKNMAEVGLVVVNKEKADLVQRVVESVNGALAQRGGGSGASQALGRALPSHTRAMVKIQEGCNQVCAYCIVPKVRGREKSIPPAGIVSQITSRVSEGYKEVVLTGTQLGSYGFDVPGYSLELLLRKILEETEIARVRVSSLQPQEITEGLLRLWENPRMCPHFHVPLQSGSASVLTSMRRRYSPQLYEEVVDRVRRVVSDVSITADVIVGFPGETEEEFEETLALSERVGFAAVHVFPYSSRPGTSAAYFQNKVDDFTKSERLNKLLSLTGTQENTFKRSFLGKVRLVLWEEGKFVDGKFYRFGLTDNYIRVYTDSTEFQRNDITLTRLANLDGELVYCSAPQTIHLGV